MAVNRYYSSTAVSTTLNGAINDAVTTIVVTSASGFPASFPYTLIIDPDGTEELVTVTAAASTTLTVTRGVDSTSAVAHDTGVTVRHGVSARDFREPQEHIAASTDVHGLAGGASVVGTSSTQTLTNKTLTSPSITSPTITTPTISSTGFTSATHAHSAASSGGTIAHSDLTALTTGDPHTQYQLETGKSAASGYASLDASTLVPIAELPTGTTGTTVALGNHGHTFSGVKAIRDATLNIPDDTWTGVYFTTADEYDTNTYHDATANEHIFTIPETGHYMFVVQMAWAGNATGRRAIDIRLNPSTNDGTTGESIGRANDSPGNAVNLYQQVVARAYLTAADTIRILAYQNSTSTIQLLGNTGEGTCYVTIDKVDIG